MIKLSIDKAVYLVYNRIKSLYSTVAYTECTDKALMTKSNITTDN